MSAKEKLRQMRLIKEGVQYQQLNHVLVTGGGRNVHVQIVTQLQRGK
jgi:hypothetical protein